jgi:hypothetical protein
MTDYVMIVSQHSTKDAYYFVGPFATDIDALVWGERQERKPMGELWWHVLDLENPGAKPRILPPTVRTIASGRIRNVIPPAPGERGKYVLCWSMLTNFMHWSTSPNGPMR